MELSKEQSKQLLQDKLSGPDSTSEDLKGFIMAQDRETCKVLSLDGGGI